jgi:hypothetical protein
MSKISVNKPKTARTRVSFKSGTRAVWFDLYTDLDTTVNYFAEQIERDDENHMRPDIKERRTKKRAAAEAA